MSGFVATLENYVDSAVADLESLAMGAATGAAATAALALLANSGIGRSTLDRLPAAGPIYQTMAGNIMGAVIVGAIGGAAAMQVNYMYIYFKGSSTAAAKA